MSNKNNGNGFVSAKVGSNFFKEMEDIISKKLRNGTAKRNISIRIITNILVRHKTWAATKEDLIKLKEEEISKYG